MNRPINDGGPAFPHGEIVHRVTLDDGRIADRVWEPHSGMTLRDHFAAKAMQGQIAFEGMEGCDPEHIANMSFELSDAMIKARERKEKQ